MFDRLSIRHKLAVLLGASAALALLISSAIAIYSTYVTETEDSLRTLHQTARILSENMRAALAFHDAESAGKILAALHSDPHMLLALVSDEHGQFLSAYRSQRLSDAQEKNLRQRLHTLRAQHFADLAREGGVVDLVEWDAMSVLQPIFFEGQRIGVLALAADVAPMWSKVRTFILMQVFSSAIALALLLYFSFRLQAIFTRPILELIAAMRKVAETKNYRLHLASRSRDEFDDLYRGFNAMLSEISDRDERLNALATTDALTGLFNRRLALETLQAMAKRAQRKGEHLGVIMLDIDFFKRVNDRYGHAVGDHVLKEVARVLRACTREVDFVARLGGEEFLVLCDNGTPAILEAMAERIRSSIAAHRIEYEAGRYVQVTVSLGLYSIAPGEQGDIGQWLVSADEALYRAKETGRNRFVIATKLPDKAGRDA
ncbi:MAG: diguanylate cyclase [Rhodocyclaceae bacterium]|nr:diguanylate cyclase [Rhodocyclaceae bacterium]